MNRYEFDDDLDVALIPKKKTRKPADIFICKVCEMLLTSRTEKCKGCGTRPKIKSRR